MIGQYSKWSIIMQTAEGNFCAVSVSLSDPLVYLVACNLWLTPPMDDLDTRLDFISGHWLHTDLSSWPRVIT